MNSSILKGLHGVLEMPKLMMSRDSARFYASLGDDVVKGQDEHFRDGDKPLWLNLGYWKSARTYPEAAAALAHLVGEAAELGPEDELLDAGYGYGDQDFLWVERFGVKRITGLNITPLHVEHARKRAQQRGLADRVDLRFGSATEMPVESCSFDKVIALESAFHFDTRDRFFQEAFRVLKPGGRLVTADGARARVVGPLSFVNRLVLKSWSVPAENMYDQEEYCRRLEAYGFRSVRSESIRKYVFPGSVKYRKLRERGLSMKNAVVELTEEEVDECYGLDEWSVTGFTDYAIFTANKPKDH